MHTYTQSLSIFMNINVHMHTCMCAYLFTLFNIEYWTQLCLVRSFVRSFVCSPVFILRFSFLYTNKLCVILRKFKYTKFIHTYMHIQNVIIFSIYTNCVTIVLLCHRNGWARKESGTSRSFEVGYKHSTIGLLAILIQIVSTTLQY